MRRAQQNVDHRNHVAESGLAVQDDEALNVCSIAWTVFAATAHRALFHFGNLEFARSYIPRARRGADVAVGYHTADFYSCPSTTGRKPQSPHIIYRWCRKTSPFRAGI